MGQNYDNNDTAMTFDLSTNYYGDVNVSHVEQTKNLHEQNFEPLNMPIAILDEDKETQFEL